MSSMNRVKYSISVNKIYFFNALNN
jgi:hypothetical protein